MRYMLAGIAGLVVFSCLLGLVLGVYSLTLPRPEITVYSDYTITTYRGNVTAVRLSADFISRHPIIGGCDTADFSDPNGHVCLLLAEDTIRAFFAVGYRQIVGQ